MRQYQQLTGVWFGLASALLTSGLMLAGCAKNDEKKTEGDDHTHHAEHDSVGPHGGMILEWGQHEYHVELVLDRAKKQATVYLLDGSLKKPATIDAAEIFLLIDSPSKNITLKASPENDPAGKSSRFVGTDEALGQAQMLKGSVTGKAGGKGYSGAFDEAKFKEDKEHKDEHEGEHKDGEHKDGEHKDGEHKDDEHKDHEHKDGEHKDHE